MVRRKVAPISAGSKYVFVITDASSRTGIAAARTAAELGGEVIILDSVQNLEAAPCVGNAQCLECDLHDFASVHRAIDIIRSRYSAIFCLATGAGAIEEFDAAEADGDAPEEEQMQMARILLASELLPLLEAHAAVAKDARIVNHSGIRYTHAANDFHKNKGVLCSSDGGDATTEIQEEDDLNLYMAPKVARSTLRSSTAFKNKKTRPGTPVLVLSQFVRIRKAKGALRRSSGSKSPTRLVYSGLY